MCVCGGVGRPTSRRSLAARRAGCSAAHISCGQGPGQGGLGGAPKTKTPRPLQPACLGAATTARRGARLDVVGKSCWTDPEVGDAPTSVTCMLIKRAARSC